MMRFCLFSCVLLLLLLGAPVFSQVQTQPNTIPDTAAGASDSLANQPQPAQAQPQEQKGEAKLTIDTLWKMTEQAGGLRWVIYLVFIVGVGAIIFKSLQLWFDARYTRPFIKQRSEAEEAALDLDQGAVDLPEIQQKASEILEGGKTAFIQRKEKYGF